MQKIVDNRKSYRSVDYGRILAKYTQAKYCNALDNALEGKK
jgi:hypothetical protein